MIQSSIFIFVPDWRSEARFAAMAPIMWACFDVVKEFRNLR